MSAQLDRVGNGVFHQGMPHLFSEETGSFVDEVGERILGPLEGVPGQRRERFELRDRVEPLGDA